MMPSEKTSTKSNKIKFLIVSILFVCAVILLIISATKATTEFFMTVGEIWESENDFSGQSLRVSGAVIGKTIDYDVETGYLHFTIAHIPGDEEDINRLGGLENVLHQAVNDPDNPKLTVVYHGAPPDMLQNEAQAILTGSLGEDGVFQVEELLLKCPSKYEEALPEQVQESTP